MKYFKTLLLCLVMLGMGCTLHSQVEVETSWGVEILDEPAVESYFNLGQTPKDPFFNSPRSYDYATYTDDQGVTYYIVDTAFGNNNSFGASNWMSPGDRQNILTALYFYLEDCEKHVQFIEDHSCPDGDPNCMVLHTQYVPIVRETTFRGFIQWLGQ